MRRRYAHRPSHPKANDCGMVAVDEMGDDAPQEQERAGNAFMIDRYMEGTQSPVDGSDIGNRAKRREHMKIHGLVDAADYAGEWAKKAEQREKFRRGEGTGQDWVGRFERTHYELNSRRK
jgi:hypothetical protein